MKLAREFKQFLLRGNVVDLAVALILALAFFAVVSAFIADLITPLIAAIFGQPDFADLTFTVNNSVFRYGHFINVVIAFILIAAVLFFFVVKPVNALISRSRKEPPADPTTRKCPQCLSEIPIGARRCPYCTSEIPPA